MEQTIGARVTSPQILNLFFNTTMKSYTAKIGSRWVVKNITEQMFKYTDFWKYKSSHVKEDDIAKFIEVAKSNNIEVVLN